MQFDRVRRQPNPWLPTGELATASQRNFRIAESADPSEHLAIDKLAFTRYKHVLQKMQRATMSEKKRDYAIGYGKPPKGRPFQKGQSGNPRTPRGQNGFAALLAAELDERVTITINGRRRRMTNREAIVAQMVDKSTRADLRAIKMLADMQKEAEAKAGTASPGSAELTGPAQSTAPGKLAAEDREVVELFVARLRRQIAAEAAEAAAADPQL